MPSRVNGLDRDETPSSQSESTDTSLSIFSDSALDPVDYLNSVLPRLSLLATQSQTNSLAEASTSTQTLLTQLGAQSSRHSSTLTQLTEDILRSGSRLAYEVEILRGDTIGLSDALTDTLQHEIGLFQGAHEDGRVQEDGAIFERNTEDSHLDRDTQEPEYIAKLRMLNQVKLRLEDVISAFGDAMEWPVAPSELSLTSSFISVSAPEPGSETQHQEEKGKEVAGKLRAEIQSLVSGGGQDLTGLAAAERRVEYLRSLALVWKGTAEEKARNKFVDALMKTVEERKRSVGLQERLTTTAGPRQTPDRPGRSQVVESNDSTSSRGGLFKNLQRLRDEIYLE